MKYHLVYEVLWIESSIPEMLGKPSTNQAVSPAHHCTYIKIAHVDGDPVGFATSQGFHSGVSLHLLSTALWADKVVVSFILNRLLVFPFLTHQNPLPTYHGCHSQYQLPLILIPI